ncbi:hypothetical protein CPY51_15850 [Rhizobium tubonense]|uniref:Uncharacterized protein n=1 Tax=Rhizobium tubonense TaxID=484088 RepID=A0A2W4CRL7_9HYPH|nr:hypothetical protein CPY51_15850 [Rhizobium tubonense]
METCSTGFPRASSELSGRQNDTVDVILSTAEGALRTALTSAQLFSQGTLAGAHIAPSASLLRDDCMKGLFLCDGAFQPEFRGSICRKFGPEEFGLSS